MTAQNKRPRIVIDSIDYGPADLETQLPLRAELLRSLPGSDRSDYSLVVVNEPIRFHTTVAHLKESGIDLAAADPQRIRVNDDGSVDLLVVGLVMGSRFVGTTIHLSMKDFPVNIAYIIDTTQMTDAKVVFSKSYPAAVGFISMDKSALPEADNAVSPAR